ncbi:hypothetical protein [Anaerotruncus rubiinfantis]|uniref:hypothetical protein n=1 Tax=Anaerotruncus rubiinfantis TaxID=1720200 RepID=UPI0034A2B6EA
MKIYNLSTGRYEDDRDKVKVYNVNTKKTTVLPYSNETLKRPASMFKAPTLTGGSASSIKKPVLNQPKMADFKKLDYAQSKDLKPAQNLAKSRGMFGTLGKTVPTPTLMTGTAKRAQDSRKEYENAMIFASPDEARQIRQNYEKQRQNQLNLITPMLTNQRAQRQILPQLPKDFKKQLSKDLSAQIPQREFGVATEEFMNDLNAQLEADMGLREQPVTRQSISQAEENLMALQRQSVPFAATSGFVKSMADLPAVMIPFTPEQRAQYNAPFAQTTELHPLAYGTGQFAGEAIKYGTAAKMVEGMPVLQEALGRFGGKVSSALGGKVSAEVISRLAAGRISDLPLDVIYAAQETDNPQDFAKNLGINTAMGLGTDVGLETIGKLWRMGKTAAASNAPGGENWYNRKMDELKDPFGVAPETKPGYNQVGGDLSGRISEQTYPPVQTVGVDREGILGRFRAERQGDYTTVSKEDGTRAFQFREIVGEALTPIQKTVANQAARDRVTVHFADGPVQIKTAAGTVSAEPGGIYIGDGVILLTGDGQSYRHELRHFMRDVISSDVDRHIDAVQFYTNTSSPRVAQYIQQMLDNYQNLNPNFKTEDIWDELSAGFYNDPSPDVWDGFFTDFEAVQEGNRALERAFDQWKGRQSNSGGKTSFTPLPEVQRPTLPESDPILQSRNWEKPKVEEPTLNGYGKNTVGAGESGQTRTQKTSKVYENTFQNTPLFTAAEKNAANLNNMQLDYRYDVIGEQQSLKEAAQRLQVDYAGEVADLPNKARFDGVDTDTAVMILRDLTEKARQTGDYSEVKKWAKMIQERGTEAGQSIQAFAKYSRTPEGVAVKAQKAVSDEFDKFAAKDPNLAKAMDDLANRLEQIAKEYQYDLPADPQQAAQRLREAVENVMNDKSYRRLKLDESFSDRVIKALQDSRSGKDVYADIIKEFEGIPTLSGEDLMQIMDIMAEAEKLPLYSKARLDVENQAYKIVADKFNSSFMDKWNAWRYIAMLGNTRTHIRNLVGNTLFGGVTRIKNDVGALVEGAVDKTSKRLGGEGIQRTKVLINPFDIKDRAIKTAANSDFENMYTLITGGGKYNPSDMIRDNQTVFKTKWLEKLRKGNSNLLELEDSVALRARYTENLTRYIKANGYDASIFANSSKQAQDVLDAARGYAIEQAQKATFRDYNELASRLSRFSKSWAKSDKLYKKAGSAVIEGALPFKKTPANIVKRGVEYSPIGLVNGIADTFGAVKRGSVSASEAIEKISAGLTGTGIMALGAFLASKGLLTGSGSDNSKERGFDALRGNQNYALKIGNRSYTLDWMAPASLPLFIGVELNSLFQEDGLTLDNALDAMTRITEPVLEMTMLQGMDDMIKSARYNETSALASVGLGAMTNYFTQAIPTAFGQVARASDPLRRTIYNEPDSRLPKFLDTARQRAQAKIPDILPWKDPLERFTSKGLQPKTDQWGREQENVGGNFPGRLAYNMLSPGYYSETRSTDADQLISSLYEQTGETGILPSNAQKSFRVDGETINLTGDQYTRANQLRGQTANRLIGALGDMEQFASLPFEDQKRLISDAYDFASAVAKSEVSNYEPDGWIEKALEAQAAGIPVETYIRYKNAFSDIEGYETPNGKYISKPEQQANMLMQDAALSQKQKELLDGLMVNDVMVIPRDVNRDYSSPESLAISQLSDSQQEAYKNLKNQMSLDQFQRYESLMEGVESTKKNGKTVNGSLKENRRRTLVNAGMTDKAAKEFLTVRYGYKWD